MHHKLNVTLENLYRGKTVKMAISRQRVKYPEGMTPQQAVTTCQTCGGHGVVLKVQRMGPMVQQVQARCQECQGNGKQFKAGVTTTQEKKQLEVRVEPGMKNGQKIVLSGEADEMPGMEPGDIIFVLNQTEHATFQRKGADLIMEKEISLKDALCGVAFAVKHLDERTIIVRSKPGEVIKPSSLRQIAGEGMPRYKRPFEKGRLFVLFRVKFPDTLDPKAVEALKACLPENDGVLKQDLPPLGDNVSCCLSDGARGERGDGRAGHCTKTRRLTREFVGIKRNRSRKSITP